MHAAITAPFTLRCAPSLVAASAASIVHEEKAFPALELRVPSCCTCPIAAASWGAQGLKFRALWLGMAA